MKLKRNNEACFVGSGLLYNLKKVLGFKKSFEQKF